jgi:hypothetical protein
VTRWRVIARLDARVAVVPHPSGVCRSYNDPATRERVSRFLRRALGVTATDAAPRFLPWPDEDDDDRMHA